MSKGQDADTMVRRARELLQRPHWPAGSTDSQAAQRLANDLKNLREFNLLTKLSKRVIRVQPNTTTVRRLHAQALIETGQATPQPSRWHKRR